MRTRGVRRVRVLGDDERRLLIAVCIVTGAITVVPATYNFVLNPMLSGLNVSESQSSMLRQLPSICALLVIFVAGSLGARVGERRVITASAALFTAGCAVVAVAPVFGVAVAGLVMESVGASVIAVVALGLLGSEIADSKARGAAFSFFAAVIPIIYMAAPVLAGALIGSTGWRSVAILWTIGGVAMFVVARRMLPEGSHERQVGELWTPALAGLALMVIVQAVSHVSRDGWTATATIVCYVGSVVAMSTLVVVYRRCASPSLSLAALKHGGALLLLIVVTLVPFAATLWFYATVGFQYVFGLSSFDTALVMVPAQAAGVLGSLVAKRVLAHHGITVAGVAGLLAISGSLLLCLFVDVDTPIWITVVIVGVFAVATTWAGIPVTNAIMDTAPAGEEGGASAFRSAATNIGRVVGVVVISAMVYGTVQSSMTTELRAQGLATGNAAQIAEKMREGSSSESVASDYAVPVERVNEIQDVQRGAMMEGFHVQAVAGAVFAAAAAFVFLGARRRQVRAARGPTAAGVG